MQCSNPNTPLGLGDLVNVTPPARPFPLPRHRSPPPPPTDFDIDVEECSLFVELPISSPQRRDRRPKILSSSFPSLLHSAGTISALMYAFPCSVGRKRRPHARRNSLLYFSFPCNVSPISVVWVDHKIQLSHSYRDRTTRLNGQPHLFPRRGKLSDKVCTDLDVMIHEDIYMIKT